MKQIELKADFYFIFDRVGEGVMYQYEVVYDWSDILINGINSKNFKVNYFGLDKDAHRYIESIGASVGKWEGAMIAYLEKDDLQMVREMFFENLTENEYAEYKKRKVK